MGTESYGYEKHLGRLTTSQVLRQDKQQGWNKNDTSLVGDRGKQVREGDHMVLGHDPPEGAQTQ